MEKETWHVFISLFLVQGRGGLGLTPLLQQLYTLYKLHVGDLFSSAMN
jgi:hypothetical protein